MKNKLFHSLFLIFFILLPIKGNSNPGDGWFPKDPKVPVKADLVKYYDPNYAMARQDFLRHTDSLMKLYPGTQVFDIRVPDPKDSDLHLDGIYIPSTGKKENLLLIAGGIHGVEGFTGSAIEELFMERYLDADLLKNTGVIILHALNPYGYKNNRRVTVNNVDMNRNCDADPALFNTKNDGYRQLYDFINPDQPANLGSVKNRLFVVRAIMKILKSGMPVLRQAVLQGQYEFPEGLYFGGKAFEPQVTGLIPQLVKYSEPYQKIIQIDLHTGYGERGKMHLFPNPPKSPQIRQATEELYAGYQIDWGDSKDFYTISGDFSNLILKLFPDKLVVPMTLEFGTMDSQKTMGSLRSIQTMILENQGFHHGYRNKHTEKVVQERIREMYNPTSEIWKTLVMDQAAGLLAQVKNKIR
jgi:hypothetical protein